MVMNKSFSTALISIALCAPAMGADMGYAPPPEYSLDAERPVQIGNGWYLRGDVGWSRERPPVIAPDAALSAALGKKDGWVAGLGAGYQFNSYFRTDLTLDYRNTMRTNAKSDPFTCVTGVQGVSDAADTPIGITAITGSCYSGQKADFKRTSLLANAYLDLGTWSGITPYVGVGVGATYGRAEGLYNWYTSNNGEAYNPDIPYPGGFPQRWLTASGGAAPAPDGFTFGKQDKSVTTSKSQVNFTWALMAGISYAVSSNAKLDFGYRFVNMGSFAPNGPKKDGQVQEFRMGLRYSPD